MTVVRGKFERVSAELAKQFASLDTATVYEAAKSGLFEADLNSVVPGLQVCGPAITAHNAAGDNLGMHVALELAEPGDVLVVASDGDEVAATWGGLVTEAAVAKGIRGLVTDGYVRDVAVCRAKGFPVFARGITPKGARKETLHGVNVPIVCGGARVEPGDLVLADDDGVVVVPRKDASAVLAGAQKRAAGEAESLEALSQGTTPFALKGMAALLHQQGVRLEGCSF